MIKGFFFIFLLFPTILLAQGNSQWRGEMRNGVYNETGLLKVWPTDGPQLLWSHEGLGEGHTSPAIANGKLYVTGLSGDKLMLFVFDLNGNLLIKKEVSKDRDDSREHAGTRSTVCVNDGKLYVYSALGQLVCLDETTLEEVWTKDLFTDFDGKNIAWGATESPLIVGEKIFMTPGGVVNNIVAMNKNTGELIWSSPAEGTSAAYCSPQYIDDQSVPMVVTSMFDYMIALHANTGEMLWSYPQKSGHNIHPNTPLYHDGMIFSTIGDYGGSLMLRLKDGGKSVEEVWKNREPDNQKGGAVKVGDYLYTSGHMHRYWFCLNWNTGEILYRELNPAQYNVIFADGMLYCYSERGEMNLIRPNPEKLDIVSSFSVPLGTGPHWAHPVIQAGVLYIRHGDAIMAYCLKEL
jgi:outer membrane protein assembly factor BamB